MSFARKVVDAIAWSHLGMKMNVALLLLTVGAPLAILVSGEKLSRTELLDSLGLWAIMGLLLTLPLSKLITYLLALRSINQLNGLCLEMQSGNFNPFDEIPPEPSEQDELQKLRHNMFWMGHVIGSRQQELKNTMEQLKEAQKHIRSSIEYAELIQKAFLPSQEEVASAFNDSFVFWEQRDGVGGDSYWFKKTENGFFVAVIDCTGHGVPGAFMTLIVQSLLDRLPIQSYEGNPARILTEMNGAIKHALSCNDTGNRPDDGMDCTFIYVEPASEKIVFSGARNYLIIRNSDGSIEEYKGDRKGVGNDSTPADFEFTNHEITIHKGMRFYMLTDGLTDQVGGERHLPFGRKRFKKIIEQPHATFDEQHIAINAAFKKYQGMEKRRDDVLVFGAEL